MMELVAITVAPMTNEFTHAFRVIAQEAPWLFAVLVVIGAAGVIVHALEFRASKKSGEYLDAETVRRRNAIDAVNREIAKQNHRALQQWEKVGRR